MNLTFTKQENWYVCEFEATNDFNIHIERADAGEMYFYQRSTSTGEYDFIKSVNWSMENDLIIDIDFVAAVYPKSIQIKSRTLPTLAEVTFAQ